MSSKKLLIITKYFTPMNEIAAVRMYSIIKYLKKLGWDIYVITDIDPSYDYQQDIVLSRIKIYGILKANISKGYGGSKIQKTNFPRKLISFFFAKIPYIKKHLQSLIAVIKIFTWVLKALNVAKGVITENKINYVIASVPSVETVYLLSKLKKLYPELVSICEYRDLISQNKIYKSMFSLLYMYTLKIIELKSIGLIDKFVFLTPIIKQEYVESFKRLNSRILDGIVITNGYDKEMYPKPIKDKDKNKLVITHVGQLYGSRTPIPFVNALHEISKDRPDIKGKIEVNFIGYVFKDIEYEAREIISKNNLTNINFIGPVSHEKAMQSIVDSDINIIITHLTGSEYAIPGKLFEYIGGGNPIFAITNDQLLKDIIIKEKLGWIAKNSINEIKERLLEIIDMWEKQNIHFDVQKNKLYDRENLTTKLNDFILYN